MSGFCYVLLSAVARLRRKFGAPVTPDLMFSVRSSDVAGTNFIFRNCLWIQGIMGTADSRQYTGKSFANCSLNPI